MLAAQANADTVEVPVVQIEAANHADGPGRTRLQVGLMVAAGVVVVGAGALTLGVLSVGSSSQSTPVAAGAVVPVHIPALSASDPVQGDMPTPLSVPEIARQVTIEVSADSTAMSSGDLTARVRDVVAASLPRIQAVSTTGMSEGSGLFITDDGYIATSAGLIAGADYVLAWTDDGQRWKARVVASDPISDVAVVHIDSSDWPAVALGSGNPAHGQRALALDHDDRTIADGTVTDVSMPIVEIDQPAAVPGSAIVDDTGSVIAMVTDDGTNRHATPAWLLERVAVDLIASGSTVHVSLGFEVADTTSPGTVVVTSVLPGSPAADAGMRDGDLIDSLNGDPVVDAASLYRQVQSSDPGDEVVLTVTRNASRRIVVTSTVQVDIPG